MIDEIPTVFQAGGSHYLAVSSGGRESWDGCCLLLPGSGPLDVDGQVGPNRFLLQLANGLAERGIRSVRFGKAPLKPRSTPVETYEAEYLEPVRGLVETLARRGERVDRVVLVGHSLGGHVAPYVAAHLSGIAGVAVINGHVSTLAAALAWQLKHAEPTLASTLSGLAAKLEKALAARAAAELADPLERYLYHAALFDAARYLDGLNIPFLCVGCGRDAQVPPNELDRWESALRRSGLRARCVCYPGLNHLCMEAETTSPLTAMRPGTICGRLLDDLARWISSVTGGRG